MAALRFARFRSPWVILFLLNIAAPVWADAQQREALQETVHITGIELTVDVRDEKGRVPAKVEPADLVLEEDGIERTIISVEPLRAARRVGTSGVTPASSVPVSAAETSAETSPEWQIVIYFEGQLIHGKSRQKVAKALMGQADQLVSLGMVDVIDADPVPVPLLRRSRDAAAVRRALAQLVDRGGANQIFVHRSQFMNDIRNLTSLSALRQTTSRPNQFPPPAIASPSNEVNAQTVKPHIEFELQTIRRFREELSAWLGSYRRHSPRALILVSGGYDLDPIEFYGQNLSKSEQVELRSYIQSGSVQEPSAALTRTLSAAGWTVLSYPGDSDGEGWLDDSGVSGIGRVYAFSSRPGQGGPKSILYRPLEPLNRVSAGTGGSLVVDPSKIGSSLDDLGDRVRVTYQVSRKPDGKARRIEIKPRNPAWRVRAASWASSTTMREDSEIRAVRLLTTTLPGADLMPAAVAVWDDAADGKVGTIDLTVGAGLIARVLPPDTSASFRVTFAVLGPRGQVTVRTREAANYDLTSGTLRLRAPITVARDAIEMVIAVEEVNTGIWGSTKLKLRE